MEQQKKTFKVPKNRVGYISKSKTGKSILTIEQDITLKAGQKIILGKPSDNIDSLVKRGFITEEVGETRKSSIPDWKTHECDLLPDREN